MSDITINEKNLSRFQKRLKHVLKKELNIEVPLHLASKIFAQTLGVSSVYELQQKINISPVNVFEKKSQQFIEEIKQFLLSNNQHGLLDLYFLKNEDFKNEITLNIEGKSLNKNDIYGFSIFFNSDKHEYILDNLNNLDLPEDTKKFILSLKQKFINSDKDSNNYLGQLIFKSLNSSHSYFSFINENKNKLYIKDYGEVIESFILVKSDFVENESLPYALHNDDYCYIELNEYKGKIERFYTLKEAYENLNPNKTLLQFLYKKQNNKSGIGAYQLYYDDNKHLIGITFNNDIKSTINSINDFENFINNVNKTRSDNTKKVY